MMTYIVIHIICSIAAYHLFKHDWRKTFDWTSGDRMFAMTMSFSGPIALMAAIAVITSEWLKPKNPNKIIAKKY